MTKKSGAQIDLLFDREDGMISLCEIKYNAKKFSIDKAYAAELANKIKVFEANFKTSKQINMVMLTSFGLKPSIWAESLIADAVTLKDLF
ncbi:MAG: ATPase [Gammaproteobacteria bacterium]|nr:ATPase [Gammaproteobacteria bacterium]